ncbi:hypothetical protein [Paracoccus onubensis]|nr:hypothetical protein [Paracoccus onubensis]
MIWIQRLVAVVFLAGLAALVVAVVLLIRQAEGVPPMPIFAGLLGAAVLILLAGASLALISIAGSARRSADALQRMARAGGFVAGLADNADPDSQPATSDITEDAMRPTRPQGKKLVATR